LFSILLKSALHCNPNTQTIYFFFKKNGMHFHNSTGNKPKSHNQKAISNEKVYIWVIRTKEEMKCKEHRGNNTTTQQKRKEIWRINEWHAREKRFHVMNWGELKLGLIPHYLWKKQWSGWVEGVDARKNWKKEL